MTPTILAALITSSIASFGASGLIILTSVVGIAVALLVFRFGWHKLRGASKETGTYPGIDRQMLADYDIRNHRIRN